MGKLSHGLTTDKVSRKIYHAWLNIKRRCYLDTHSYFPAYGGRGIFLQESWLDDPVSFCNYMKSLPNFSFKSSIDRVDNNIGYSEGNLRWATAAMQSRNTSKRVVCGTVKTGVTWTEANPKVDGTTTLYALATWHEISGRQLIKKFSTKTYGLMPAFLMACNYRDKMIAKLNEQGAGYSESHGK